MIGTNGEYSSLLASRREGVHCNFYDNNKVGPLQFLLTLISTMKEIVTLLEMLGGTTIQLAVVVNDPSWAVC